MLKRLAIAAALLAAGPALAQTTTTTQAPPAPAANGEFVMYVVPNADHSMQLSLGFLQINGPSAQIVRRRQLAPACQFNPGPDLPVSVADVTPIRPPRGLSPEQVGQYAALTFDLASTSRGANPTAEELGCINALFVQMAQETLARQQRAAQAPAQ